jgi:hypothetical protein
MALRRNDDVSVSVTRHADGAITGSVSGATSDVGDVVERFSRGVGYGIEKARLETGGGVYTSVLNSRLSWLSRPETVPTAISSSHN